MNPIFDPTILFLANAYTDSQRLGHAETERVNVMEPLTVRLEFGFVQAPSNIEFFQVGKSYAVSWNGIEYICIAQKLEEDGITGIAVGNCAQFGGTENGEPFIIIKTPDTLAVCDLLSPNVEETTVQLSIDEINEIIHTIDPKFIPWNAAPGGGTGGGLPVVELTTQPEDADSFGLNAEENAQLDALNGMPFVLKCTGLVGGKRPYHFCAIANYCESPYYDYYGYEVVAESAVFIISRTSSGWSIQFRPTSL